jgi:hypothetical protein
MEAEREAQLQGMDHMLFDEEKTPNYVPGLRARVYLRIAERNAEHFERLRPHLEQWDITAADRSGKEEIERLESLSLTFRPDYLIANTAACFSDINAASTVRECYGVKSECAALQALLACDVYRKRHGAYPASLQAACDETGIGVPVDVMTGQPVGYRVEAGAPVVWLAGFDGRDDGGTVAYRPLDDERRDGIPGTDLVYRPGQMPYWRD